MNFEDIQKLKLKNENRNINFYSAMAPLLYGQSFLKILKTLVKSLLFSPNLNIVSPRFKSDILFSYNFNADKRKDYYNIYITTLSAFQNSNQLEIKRSFDALSFPLKFFKLVKKVFFKKNLGINILSRIIIYSLELHLENLPKKIDEIYNLLNPKIYISFCDSYMEENICTQYFNSKNILTITHQHGLYRKTNSFTHGTDSEAFLNFVSNFILLWSNKTKEEFINCNINPNRLVVLGKAQPKHLKKIDSFNYNDNNFIVFLNGDKNLKSNLNLIAISNDYSNKTNTKYMVKFHPTSRRRLYKNFFNSNYVCEISNLVELRKFKFGLCHSSGIIFDLMKIGMPIYILEDKFLDNYFKIDGVTITDVDGLFSKIEYLNNNREIVIENLQEISRNYIEYYDVKTIIKRTKLILNNIITNQT
jgi:hypothetical protein